MPQSDYYKTLQVKENALDTEISVAYRKLLKKYDPHGSSPDPVKLKEINQAYRVLSNPGERADYDAQRAAGTAEATEAEEPDVPAAEAPVVDAAEEEAEADETAALDEEAIPARPRRRRRPQAETRPETDRETRRPRRVRVARTRFDRNTRNRLAMLASAVGVVVLIGIVLLVLNVPLPGQKRWDVRPRSIDIWAIYPDGQVRFTSLFYPSSDNPDTSVQMAGPLVSSSGEISSTAVMGGTQSGIELQPGPGDDADKLFPMFTIARTAGGGMYGIDVMTLNSPYVTLQQNGTSVVALGVEIQQVYRQVIVAVAFPRDAVVTPTDPNSGESFPSYRNITLGEWQIYYYDTTQATLEDPNAIRVTFQPGSFSPETDLDPYEVDRGR